MPLEITHQDLSYITVSDWAVDFNALAPTAEINSLNHPACEKLVGLNSKLKNAINKMTGASTTDSYLESLLVDKLNAVTKLNEHVSRKMDEIKLAIENVELDAIEKCLETSSSLDDLLTVCRRFYSKEFYLFDHVGKNPRREALLDEVRAKCLPLIDLIINELVTGVQTKVQSRVSSVETNLDFIDITNELERISKLRFDWPHRSYDELKFRAVFLECVTVIYNQGIEVLLCKYEQQASIVNKIDVLESIVKNLAVLQDANVSVKNKALKVVYAAIAEDSCEKLYNAVNDRIKLCDNQIKGLLANKRELLSNKNDDLLKLYKSAHKSLEEGTSLEDLEICCKDISSMLDINSELKASNLPMLDGLGNDIKTLHNNLGEKINAARSRINPDRTGLLNIIYYAIADVLNVFKAFAYRLFNGCWPVSGHQRLMAIEELFAVNRNDLSNIDAPIEIVTTHVEIGPATVTHQRDLHARNYQPTIVTPAVNEGMHLSAVSNILPKPNSTF